MTLNEGTIRVGIPQALLYHKYAPMWLHFFRALGCTVVTSPKTNRQIIEQGTQYAIDETCLAVKIYLGHIAYLVDKVDYVFIPRLVSLYKNEELCVKFFALADIVRSLFQNVSILEYTIDKRLQKEAWYGILKMGQQLHRNPFKILKAYWEALQKQQQYESAQLQKQNHAIAKFETSQTKILLAAHPYVLHDAMLGKQVVSILKTQDVELVYSDIIDTEKARSLACNISTDLYWSYNKEMIGAVEHYKQVVDGIIFLMSFPCGPDALVIDLYKNRSSDIPIAVIVMDELQGDAGLKTRLESFVDILRMSRL